MLKLIIFDLDDTLYPEEEFIAGGFQAVARHMHKRAGLAPTIFLKKLWLAFRRDGHGQVFNTVLREYDLERPEVVSSLVATYRRHSPRLKLFSGVRPLLRSLKKKYQLAMITDGHGQTQRKKIKSLNLDKYFSAIIYTDDYGPRRAKPDPYAFRQILKRFKIRAEEAVYVGNNPQKDFLVPKRLGMRTIRIKQGRFKQFPATRRQAAEHELASIGALAKLI